MTITSKLWGCYEGQDIFVYTLRNGRMEVMVSNFGAIITDIRIPGREGLHHSIVLTYDTLQDYIDDKFYVGCVVGRFAGRIAGAEFSIHGKSYPLAQNAVNAIHIHGGNKAFGKRAFSVVHERITDTTASVELYYRSPHMEEGYPGNLDVWITYELSACDELTIRYKAITDHDTHINLTNHSYFNLHGHRQDILDHRLTIDADSYLVTDKNYIPTGVIRPVKNTPYSFQQGRKISAGIQELAGTGYNECFVLNHNPGTPNAIVLDERSGRKMTLETDMPALLLYTGDYLSGAFAKHSGLCLETQFFPDTPHHQGFPATLLKAAEQWDKYTKLSFCWG